MLLLLLGPIVIFRSPGSHPRGRDEEGGSDKRTSVAEQQDKRTRSRPSSRFRPPPSHLRRVFSPSARGSIRLFPGYRNTVLTLSFSFLGTRRVSSPFLSRMPRATFWTRLSDTSRAPGHRNLDTSSSTNVGPHVPHWPHFSATAPRSPPREIRATCMTPRLCGR